LAGLHYQTANNVLLMLHKPCSHSPSQSQTTVQCQTNVPNFSCNTGRAHPHIDGIGYNLFVT